MHAAAESMQVPLLETAERLESALAAGSPAGLDADLQARCAALYGGQMMARFPWLAVYLTDQCHPNVQGQRILAAALADLVEATPSFRSWAAGTPSRA